MKKLNITKEAFEKSNYFKNKYGELEYVSESGKVFKTSKGNILKFNEGVNGFDAIEIELNPQPQGWDQKVHDEVTKKLTRKIARELGYRFRSVTTRDNASYIAIEFTSQFHIIQKAQEIVKKVKDMYPEQLVFSGIFPLKRGKFEITFEVNKKYVFDLVKDVYPIEDADEWDNI